MGGRNSDYLWQCTVLINPHCSTCGRPKCVHCEVQRVHVKDGRPGNGNARAQLKVEPTNIRRISPKKFPSLPSKANDILVNRATDTRPNSTQELPTSSLSSPSIDSKCIVKQDSLFESLPFGSPSTHISLDESLEGDNSTPAVNHSASVSPDSKEHAPHSASPDQSSSDGIDTMSAWSPIPMSHPIWLDPLLHHPLYPIIVKAWAEFWYEDLVDEGGSTDNTDECIPSSSGSTTGGGSDKRPLEGRKRERESSKKDESGDAKRVKPSDSDNCTSAAQTQSRLACHFYKMNPKQYLVCIQKSFDPIGHVKQHLKHDHKLGPNHCKSCWFFFDDEDDLRHHECTPTGGKPVDQLPSIPKRLQGRRSQWYWIWDQLFPNFPRPETPYCTDAPDAALIQQFLSFAEARYPEISNVTRVIQAAHQAWLSTPAHTLNAGQLPTPATTVSEDEIRASPAALQIVSENVNTSSNPQPPRIPTNRSDEGIASSMLPGSENLLFLSQPPMGSIDELVEEFYSSSVPTYGINTTNGEGSSSDYNSGAGVVSTLQEDMSIDRWDLQQAFIDDPSNRESYQHRTSAEEMALQDLNRSAQNLQQAATQNSSNEIFDEHWNYAEGMPADEHLRSVIDIDSIVNFRHHSWKEMNIEQPGNLDAEDSP